MAMELPSGTVTFLFSDVESSTRLLQQLGERWSDVVARHNSIMRAAFEEAGGREVDRQGDAFFAVFPRARNALAAAATAQRAIAAERWPEGAELRVRMGVHTGEPSLGDEGYLGLDVVRAARICALARGGQVLVSESTRVLARGDLGDLELQDVGEHRLKDIAEPERLFQLSGPGLVDGLAAPDPTAAGVLPVAGREIELARQALERVRELELGPLQLLGPRIEAQVEEALRQAVPAQRARGTRELHEGRDGLGRLTVFPGWAVALGAGAGIAIAFTIVAVLVWL
ncbi:MAG: adenylate/guanylate cyclase domain-containing protein [Thermoleophilia bacterium]|nr:adenylate/guanylate cyclase domain-containing protein [Thermoleophilia bacterium]